MDLNINQLLPLLARLDPGLTKQFLLSSTVPLVVCSCGLLSIFDVYDHGLPLSFAFLPVYNTVSIWRRGIPLSIPILLYNGTITLHGLVLGIYMYQRKSIPGFQESFDKHIISPSKVYSSMRDASLIMKIFNWLGMTALITCFNAIPYLYTLRGDGTCPSALVGLSLIALGSVLQATADYQKQRHKALHGPESYCKDGVYRICRHPNYLGEIMYHLGVLVSGYSLFPSIPRWLLIGSVPLLMTPIMLFVTNAFAKRQEKKYSSDPSFKEYQRSVNKLIPFLW